MIFPLLTTLLIFQFGWRDAWLWYGAITIVLLLPAGLTVRTRPERMGLLPDGEVLSEPHGEGTRATAASLETSLTRDDALHTSSFWLIGTAYMLTVVRIAGSGYGDTYNFEWTLEDLDAETTETATTGSGDASSGTGLFSFGTSSYSNDGSKMGSVIMMSSTAAADIALAQDFLRARYTGASTTTTTSVDLSATFFAEIDIDTK